MAKVIPYKRVLLKVSGEALAGHDNHSIDNKISPEMLTKLVQEIKQVHELGVDVCLVVGGGNIHRGVPEAKAFGIDRATSDSMGILATVINGLALSNAVESMGLKCALMSAIPMPVLCESYTRRDALEHLKNRKIVIFVAGTGNPFFTTDSAAALRASEMNCDLLLKATKVDGVFDSDPVKNPNAKRYDKISYQDVLSRNLQVMDTAAIALARESRIPIGVYSIYDENGFAKVILGKTNFTIIEEM